MRAVLAALILTVCLGPLSAEGAKPTQADRVRIAVMYFENGGNPDLEMLRVGLAQMLITDLSGESRFDIVERTRLNELLAEQDLQASGAVDADTAVGLGRILGARYMVLGAYFEVMGQLRVDARVVDVETSRIVSVGARQPSSGLWDLHDELVGAIAAAVGEAEVRRGAWDAAHPPTPRIRTRGALQMNDDTEAQGGAGMDEAIDESTSSEAVRSVQSGPDKKERRPEPEPPTPAAPADPMGAAIAFSEGLDFLDRKDLTRARKRFERAVELDPTLDDAKTELASLSI